MAAAAICTPRQWGEIKIKAVTNTVDIAMTNAIEINNTGCREKDMVHYYKRGRKGRGGSAPVQSRRSAVQSL